MNTQPARKRVAMVCSVCRGSNVKADAFACWNVNTQEWEVASTHDKGAWCDDCDGETRIERTPIA